MPKASSSQLLFPGETSWEIWAASTDLSQEPLSPHPVSKPSEIDKFPSGDLIHIFPVRAFTALPLHVPTGDATLFPDMAATHSERLGFRPDPLSGQLTDIFPIFTNSRESTFLHVILKSPATGDLPLKSPAAFDISPRALPASGNTLTFWKELGLWVFAIHLQGKLLYCQATSSSASSPDAATAREARIALGQINMQGISSSPDQIIIWSSSPECDPSLLSSSFSIPATVSPRPAPIRPDPPSHLLPADVRAARKTARKRRNAYLTLSALLTIYFGTAAFLGYQLYTTRANTGRVLREVAAIAPEGEAYALHIAKWDELAHAIDRNYNTVDILSRVARSIPPGSGLRLRTADISPTEIRLVGEAPLPQGVNEFSKNLTSNNNLLSFQWETPEPKQSSRGWEFVFTGSIPSATP